MTLRRTTKKTRSEADRLASYQWRIHVLDGQFCAVPGCDDPNLEAHHVLTQQQLRNKGFGDKLWDPRNGMCLCTFHHARHTMAKERIPFGLLSADAIEFASELGLDWLLDRYYPKAVERDPSKTFCDGGTRTCEVCVGSCGIEEYEEEEAA